MTEHIGEQQADISHSFQAMFEYEELFEKIVDFFPYPVQVFSPDGTAIRTNRATLEAFGLCEEKHVGKYNVFRDPIVAELGILDQVKQVLSGKTVYLTDLIAPYQDIVKYFNSEDQDILTLYLDITCFPLMKPDNTVGCFIAVFIIKKYTGAGMISKKPKNT